MIRTKSEKTKSKVARRMDQITLSMVLDAQAAHIVEIERRLRTLERRIKKLEQRSLATRAEDMPIATSNI